jgi:hypothetical protein
MGLSLFAPSIADAEVAIYLGDRKYDVTARLTGRVFET